MLTGLKTITYTNNQQTEGVIKKRSTSQKRAKVKRLYKALFGTDWPNDWKVNWHVLGVCNHANQMIYLFANDFDHPDDLRILIHELVHMHNPQIKHGKRFDKIVAAMTKEAQQICESN